MRARYLSAGQRRRVALAMLRAVGREALVVGRAYDESRQRRPSVARRVDAAHVADGGLAVIATHQPDEFATPRSIDDRAVMSAFKAVFVRDLRVAFRRWSELAHPLIFFMIVVTLFPLALSPTTPQLRDVGTGVLVGGGAAILAARLGRTVSWRCRRRQPRATLAEPGTDDDHGARENRRARAGDAAAADLSRACDGVLSYNIPLTALPTLALALLLAAPTLSVFVAFGAALTVSLRRGGSIVGLLVLPLTGPLLIFGTRATDLSINGEPTAAPLFLLAALAVLAVSLGPLAIAAAVKVGLE